MTNDEKTLRRLLWLRHGCPPHTLYGDDGEMQCNRPGCMIDFKRMSASEIEDNWRRRAKVLLAKAQQGPRPSQADCPERRAHGANGLVGCSTCGWELV